MRHAIVGVLAILTGCAQLPVVTRVRDPWQVAVVDVTNRDDVPHTRRGKDCEWRDDAGFPHFCDFGDFLVSNDGAIVTPDAKNTGANVRLLAHILDYGWCMRPLRRCFRRVANVAFVTPTSNVTAMRRRVAAAK